MLAQVQKLNQLRLQKTLIEERKALAIRRDALMEYLEEQERLKDKWGYAYHGMSLLKQGSMAWVETELLAAEHRLDLEVLRS